MDPITATYVVYRVVSHVRQHNKDDKQTDQIQQLQQQMQQMQQAGSNVPTQPKPRPQQQQQQPSTPQQQHQQPGSSQGHRRPIRQLLGKVQDWRTHQPQSQQQSRGQASVSQPSAPEMGGQDPFLALKGYDTVFVVDDSESMEMHWKATMTSLEGVVEKAVQYDTDGIDIYFLNSPVVLKHVRTAQEVRSLFSKVQPRHSTPIASALKRVVEPYLATLEASHRAKETGGQTRHIKPMSILVLTDGSPDRNEEPEGVIVNAGKRLGAIRAPAAQLGFSFIQIGQDEEAEQQLFYLDNHLNAEHGIRDMVDTIVYEGDGVMSSDYLLKALLGGMQQSVDVR